jgi:hypothetical protein
LVCDVFVDGGVEAFLDFGDATAESSAVSGEAQRDAPAVGGIDVSLDQACATKRSTSRLGLLPVSQTRSSPSELRVSGP